MKLKYLLKLIAIIASINPLVVFSDVTIKSPLGTQLIFSEKKTGEHYDPYAWGKLLFKGSEGTIDLGIEDRYFTEDGSSEVSPSGRYLKVDSVSGGYLYLDDGKKKYVDRAYCSIIDMSTGCYISDWDGEACAYDWKKNEDILENSTGTEVFDFLSFRGTIMNVKNLSLLNEETVKLFLRCDAPDQKNINTYQKLATVNKTSKALTVEHIGRYLNRITTEKEIATKSYFYSSPNDNSKTKAYLVPGDKIKIIDNHSAEQWINIGYINTRGIPLVAWIRTDSLEQ